MRETGDSEKEVRACQDRCEQTKQMICYAETSQLADVSLPAAQWLCRSVWRMHAGAENGTSSTSDALP